jgi:Pyruvate/2-oxoacid:ferredoxin oxidoreductase gamma subunit
LLNAANVVLIGALSNFFPELKPERWIDAIKSLLAPRLHEINIKALNEGRAAINS